jgi:hypothetical protein
LSETLAYHVRYQFFFFCKSSRLLLVNRPRPGGTSGRDGRLAVPLVRYPRISARFRLVQGVTTSAFKLVPHGVAPRGPIRHADRCGGSAFLGTSGDPRVVPFRLHLAETGPRTRRQASSPPRRPSLRVQTTHMSQARQDLC